MVFYSSQMFSGFLAELQKVTGATLKRAGSVDLSIARIRDIWTQRKDHALNHVQEA
jgi:hypothetical protein